MRWALADFAILAFYGRMKILMKRLFVALVSVALVGAGCGSSNEPTVESLIEGSPAAATGEVGAENVTSTEAEALAAPASEPAQKTAPRPTPKKTVTKPATVYVTITDEAFSPSAMAVMAGATVVWTNKSSKNQTVRSDGSNIYDSGNIPPGGTYKRVFEWPGSYVYYTAGPKTFKGTVIVR